LSANFLLLIAAGKIPEPLLLDFCTITCYSYETSETRLPQLLPVRKMNNHLEKFIERTYHAKETIIISLFGDVNKLEDYNLFYLLQPEHYLLLKKDDLKNTEFLREKISSFATTVKKNWTIHLEKLITTFIDKINFNTSLKSSAFIRFYLNELFSDDTATNNNLNHLFEKNIDEFKKELQKKNHRQI